MDDRRKGPINGKIGTATEAVKQLSPVLWLVIAIATILGFKFQTPNDRYDNIDSAVHRVQAQVDSVRGDVSALVRLQCIKASNQDRKLAGLKCD